MSILTHHLLACKFLSKISIESWFHSFITKLPYTGHKKRKRFQRRKLFRKRGSIKNKEETRERAEYEAATLRMKQEKALALGDET